MGMRDILAAKAFVRFDGDAKGLKATLKQVSASLQAHHAAAKRMGDSSTAQKTAWQLSGVQSAIEQIKPQPLNGVSKKLGELAGAARGFSTALVGAGAALTAFGAGGILALAKVSASYAEVSDTLLASKGIARATKAEYAALSETVLALGASTSFTANEVAFASKELAKAGFSIPQIQKALASTLDLARASGESLQDTSAIIARGLSQFDLGAEDTTHAVDVLGVAINEGVLTLTDMAESLKFMGQIGKQLGFTMEETASAFTVLANNGLRGGVAARQLKRAFIELSKDAKLDVLKEQLSVNPFDADGSAKPLAVVLREIGDALESLNPQQNLNLLDSLFGEGSPAMASLISNLDDFEETLAAVGNADGAMRDLAETMDSDVGGSIRLAVSAATDLWIALGSAGSSHVRAFLQFVRTAAGDISKWVKENKDLASSLFAIVGVGSGLAAFTGAVALATAGLGAMAAAAWGVNAALVKANISWMAFVVSTGGLAVAVATLAALALEAAGGIAALAKAYSDVSEAGEKVDPPTHLKTTTKLSQLAGQATHTAREIADAAQHVKTLEEEFGGLGVTVNQAGDRILGLARALDQVDARGALDVQTGDLADAESAVHSLIRKRAKLKKSLTAEGVRRLTPAESDDTLDDLLAVESQLTNAQRAVRRLKAEMEDIEVLDLSESNLSPPDIEVPVALNFDGLSDQAADIAALLAPLKNQSRFGKDVSSDIEKVFAGISPTFQAALDSTDDLTAMSMDEVTSTWSEVIDGWIAAGEQAQSLNQEDIAKAFMEAGQLAAKRMAADLKTMEAAAKESEKAAAEASQALRADAKKIQSQVKSAQLQQRQGAFGSVGLGDRMARQTINIEELQLREHKKGNSLLSAIEKVLANQRGLVAGAF